MIPKFRVWDKDNKYMEYTDKNLVVCFSDEGADAVDHTTFSLSCTSMENFELMQSTGLKDITGDEIYEGDIVKVLVHDIEPKIMKDKMYVGVVDYKQGTFDIKNSENTYLGIIPQMYMSDIDCVFRILGNIYENPELLEGQRMAEDPKFVVHGSQVQKWTDDIQQLKQERDAYKRQRDELINDMQNVKRKAEAFDEILETAEEDCWAKEFTAYVFQIIDNYKETKREG